MICIFYLFVLNVFAGTETNSCSKFGKVCDTCSTTECLTVNDDHYTVINKVIKLRKIII